MTMWEDLYSQMFRAATSTAGYAFVAFVLYMLFVFNEWLKHRHLHMSELRSTLRVSAETRKQLAHLSGLMHSDRAMLLMFHNGEHFSNGSSILKLSCVTEFHTGSLIPASDQLRGVLVSTVEDAVQDLLLPVGQMRDINMHEIHINMIGYWPTLMTSIGAQYWCILPLLTDQKVIGIVMFTWQNAPKEHHLRTGLKEILEGVKNLEYTVNNYSDAKYTDADGTRRNWFWAAFGRFINRR